VGAGYAHAETRQFGAQVLWAQWVGGNLVMLTPPPILRKRVAMCGRVCKLLIYLYILLIIYILLRKTKTNSISHNPFVFSNPSGMGRHMHPLREKGVGGPQVPFGPIPLIPKAIECLTPCPTMPYHVLVVPQCPPRLHRFGPLAIAKKENVEMQTPKFKTIKIEWHSYSRGNTPTREAQSQRKNNV
jgi:hypothetical protein